MTVIPQTLEEAIAQAKEATRLALNSGSTKLQIELVIPEIALKAQYLAYEFTSIFRDYESGLKVLFPDTGAAALARREWGETIFQVSDLGSSRTSIETRISDIDQAFLVVSPSAVEVAQVEQLCNLAGERPVVLIIPQLEDLSIVGIGYAARKLRERFLSTLESSYYFRPLEEAVVLRSYPGLWQVWRQLATGEPELINEQSYKPLGEALDRILKGDNELETGNALPSSTGFFASVKNFLRALNS
jgi:hypothetical protein